jgi:2-polyprenyl-3-methyl-5-hydroxy-6-metoxy-1,4-benzoquinol methylase
MNTHEGVVYGKYAQRMLLESGTGMRAAEPAALRALQERLDELLCDTQPVYMLDAGCGKLRAIPVADELYIVGIDVSEEEISRNDLLSEAIVGDIQTYDLGDSRFDVIICWNVLEHVEAPIKALLNFKTALKPGGLLVLAVPHAMSVKGLATRFTPYWFHDKFRSWIKPDAHSELVLNAFPTVMSPAITPKRLRAFARDNALSIEFLTEYENWQQKKLRAKLKLTGGAFRAIQKIIAALSLGSVTASATDALVVMQKTPSV